MFLVSFKLGLKVFLYEYYEICPVHANMLMHLIFYVFIVLDLLYLTHMTS